MNFSDCSFNRYFKKNLAGVFLGLLVASCAIALPVPMLDGAPPVIDGDLSDACWQHCAPITNLFYAPGAEQPMEVQTSVRICRDAAWLYLALRCDEPAFNRILASEIPRDGATSKDDNVEIYIDPGTGGKAAGQFVLAVGGGKRDVWFDGKRTRDLEWNISWRGAAKLDPHIDSASGWSAELAIPLAALGECGGSQVWRINVCRTRRASSPSEYSALARVPRDGGFYCPSKFLTLDGINAQNVLSAFSPLLGEIKLSPLAWNGAAFVFTVNVALTNSADAAGSALLVFRDESGGSLEDKVELRSREGKTISRLITADNASARAVTVCLKDAGLPEEWRDICRVRGAGMLDGVFPDRNYYTTEQTALVYVELGMARADIEHSGLLAQVAVYNANALQNGILDKKARVLAASDWTRCVSKLMAVSLPLNELAPGKYVARLTLARPGAAQSKSWWSPWSRKTSRMDVLATETFDLRKHVPLTGKAHEVKIDRYNRCILVDNQPFFPIGVDGLTEYPYTTARAYHDKQTALCREAGINTVLEWISYPVGTPEAEALAERRQYLESLSAQGLKIIAKSYNARTLVDSRLGRMYANPHFRSNVFAAIRTTLPPVIEMCRANPDVLAYYHFDEPSTRDFEDVLEAWADAIRALDPYHPVYMSLTRRIHAPGWFGTVADLLGAHNYWYVMNPESFIRQAEFLADVNEAACRAGTPTMHVLQLDGWGWEYGDGGLMTPLEQRASSFLALVHGARSLVYFILPFRHQASVAAQKTISRDIQALAPALLTREPQQEILLEPAEAVIKANSRMFPVIQTRLMRDPNGEQVLLAINMAREPVTASFAVLSLANQKSVRDRIGAQKVSVVADGALTDTIEGLGVRAYAWKPDNFAADTPVQIKIKVSGPGADWACAGAPWAEPKPRGKNLLKNSSFEKARMEGVPDYWSWPVGSGPLPPDPHAAGLETNHPFHGAYCYRLPGAPGRMMRSDNIGALKVGKAYTVSLYARADKPDTPIEVWLQSYANRGKFTIGTEWQRVSFSATIVEKAGPKRYYFSAWRAGQEPEGVVYFDAVQVEEAESASDYEP